MSTSGISRRSFLDLAASVAGGAIAAGPSMAAQVIRTAPAGSANKVRIGLIGSGNRGREVSGLFTKNLPDANYVAVADPWKTNLDKGVELLTTNQNGAKLDAYEDYRRILDRKDIDAVHIATPDHWHCDILVEALSAGKDIYVEKPLSNTVERAVKALKAYKSSNRIVQLGTQQRSGQNWQEAAKVVQNGDLGKITHAVLTFPGSGYGQPNSPEGPPPEGLNWDLWQGPAPKHAWSQSRMRWRGWWDYGGGLITDWGVHLTQIALWFLNAETEPPILTSASSQYINLVDPEHQESPDAVVVSWVYKDFVMSFTNATVMDWEFGRQGNQFFGSKGSMTIHRQGWEIRPPAGANPRNPAPAGSVVARRVPWREYNGSDNDSFTIAHGRNFLDSVKGRTKAIVDLEAGFYASLPCILGCQAVREGKTLKWDNTAMKAIAV
jgi:predicted dehydrogenase